MKTPQNKTGIEPEPRSGSLDAVVRAQHGEPKCKVENCAEPAACELAVDGEWFPVCSKHAVNRFMPRRNLRPNDPDQRPKRIKP